MDRVLLFFFSLSTNLFLVHFNHGDTTRILYLVDKRRLVRNEGKMELCVRKKQVIVAK